MSEWEDRCDGCAKCCEIGDTGVACPHLDAVTRRCRVYETRHEEAPWCARVTPDTLPKLHKDKILPASCAYIRHAEGLPPLEEIEPARLIPYTMADRAIVEKHERLVRALGR